MSHTLMLILLFAGIMTGKTMFQRRVRGGLLLLLTCSALAVGLFSWRCTRPSSPLLVTGLNNAALLQEAEGEAMGNFIANRFPGTQAVIIVSEDRARGPAITALRQQLQETSTVNLFTISAPLTLPPPEEEDAAQEHAGLLDDPAWNADWTGRIQAELARPLAAHEVAIIADHHGAALRAWRALPAAQRPILAFTHVDPIRLPDLFRRRTLTAATLYYASPEIQADLRRDPRLTPKQARTLFQMVTAENAREWLE